MMIACCSSCIVLKECVSRGIFPLTDRSDIDLIVRNAAVDTLPGTKRIRETAVDVDALLGTERIKRYVIIVPLFFYQHDYHILRPTCMGKPVVKDKVFH